MPPSPLIIIADTNVLINFLNIERLDLIAGHSHDFVITDHVKGEITDYYAHQKNQLEQAIRDGTITEQQLSTIEELNLFGILSGSGRLGHGECSAISCAIYGEHKLAIDDKRAMREALNISAELEILKTQDLVLSMINENLLSLSEADELKEAWETQFRFRLKFESFSELLAPEE